MGADTRHSALIKDYDAVGIFHRADALGNNQTGGALQISCEPLAKRGIGTIIQSREGIVENEDLRLAGYGAGDGEPLLLAA